MGSTVIKDAEGYRLALEHYATQLSQMTNTHIGNRLRWIVEFPDHYTEQEKHLIVSEAQRRMT